MSLIIHPSKSLKSKQDLSLPRSLTILWILVVMGNAVEKLSKGSILLFTFQEDLWYIDIFQAISDSKVEMLYLNYTFKGHIFQVSSLHILPPRNRKTIHCMFLSVRFS